MQAITDQKFQDKRAMGPFVKRMFKQSLKHKRIFWIMVLNVLGVAIVDATLPFIFKDFIDLAVMPFLQANKAGGYQWGEFLGDPTVQRFLWIYGVLTVVNSITIAAFIYGAGKMRANVIHDLRKAMFEKLQRLSFSYYDKSAIGWLTSRITSDADRVAELISWGFISFLWGGLMVLFCFSFMFSIDWKLALMVMISIPLLAVVTIRVRMLILRYARMARRLNSDITARFNEHINGVEVNKSTVQEERVSGNFRSLSEEMRQASFKASYYTAMYMPLVVMVGSIAAILVIYFGANRAVLAGITIGTLVMFMTYARMIFDPIVDIVRFYAIAQDSLSAGERIFNLIDEEVTIKDKGNEPAYGRLQGEIEFRNLGFHYVEDKPIFRDFNLHIKAGESIALVGPTGHGKTTISSLVSRFYEPISGELLVDGVDYRQRTLQSLRDQLGIILQTPHLFSGTIRENIQFGKPGATNDEVEHSLSAIGADAFIARLDEEVGEEGAALSNGEKQIISFARAIIKDPKILILDEATSSVDTMAEARIQKGIESIIKGRTSIIIAHRLSTIKHCDRIIVIKNGQIDEEGTHTELMKLKGHYYHLYTNQVRKAEKAA